MNIESALPWLSAISIIFSLFSGVYAWHRTRKRTQKEKMVEAIEEALDDYGKLHDLDTMKFHSECRDEIKELISEQKTRVDAIEFKIDIFWRIVEKEFPKLLKQVTTPELDIILEIAEKGYDHLDEEKAKNLYNDLQKEYQKALREENACRGFLTIIYLVGLSRARGYELPVGVT